MNEVEARIKTGDKLNLSQQLTPVYTSPFPKVIKLDLKTSLKSQPSDQMLKTGNWFPTSDV